MGHAIWAHLCVAACALTSKPNVVWRVDLAVTRQKLAQLMALVLHLRWRAKRQRVVWVRLCRVGEGSNLRGVANTSKLVWCLSRYLAPSCSCCMHALSLTLLATRGTWSYIWYLWSSGVTAATLVTAATSTAANATTATATATLGRA